MTNFPYCFVVRSIFDICFLFANLLCFNGFPHIFNWRIPHNICQNICRYFYMFQICTHVIHIPHDCPSYFSLTCNLHVLSSIYTLYYPCFCHIYTYIHYNFRLYIIVYLQIYIHIQYSILYHIILIYILLYYVLFLILLYYTGIYSVISYHIILYFIMLY